jgi:hypothetical protein
VIYNQLEHEEGKTGPKASIKPPEQDPVREVFDRIPPICQQLAIAMWEISHSARDLHIDVGMY